MQVLSYIPEFAANVGVYTYLSSLKNTYGVQNIHICRHNLEELNHQQFYLAFAICDLRPSPPQKSVRWPVEQRCVYIALPPRRPKVPPRQGGSDQREAATEASASWRRNVLEVRPIRSWSWFLYVALPRKIGHSRMDGNYSVSIYTSRI